MGGPNPVHRAHTLLRILGWSAGDMSYRDTAGVVWQVIARRGEDRIFVRGPTQADAWDEALRLAGVVQRG